MVGRLSPHDREAIAKTIVALSNNDKQTTARILRENGYAATFRDNENVDDATLHRFATFCLDKFDLSPITLDNGEVVDTSSWRVLRPPPAAPPILSKEEQQRRQRQQARRGTYA